MTNGHLGTIGYIVNELYCVGFTGTLFIIALIR